MYGDLKRCQPNEMKGDIGEIIAWHYLNRISRPKHDQIDIINKSKFNDKQKSFLKENWRSLDLIDLENSIIYEVKTKNYNYGKLKGVKNKPSVSEKFIPVMEKAKELGFETKLVFITFYTNWRYGLEIKEFRRSLVCPYKNKSGWQIWKNKKIKYAKAGI
jgi:hypothetical protein